MRKIIRKGFFAIILFCSNASVFSQAPSFTAINPVNTNVVAFEKFEAIIALKATYTNPYDYENISVQGVFTSPTGKKDTVDAFFMDDYTLNTSTGNVTATGIGSFRLRYAPVEVGSYSYLVTCKDAVGSATSASNSFQSQASSKKGFLRKKNTNYLNFDNGEQFIPVGHNLGWQENNKFLNFKTWTDKLAANKANFIRVWQCHWGLGIEWTGSPYNGLKRYSQVNSFYTDKLLEECNAKDIYLMLCINHHGMVSTRVNPEWSTSPYNVANGGPCNNVWDYFTNATAKKLHKNRLRYIVARWGYARNIMSWELFNEVDWTDDFSNRKNAVKDWHIEMGNYLKSIDVRKHLVTTSYAHNEDDPATWKSTAIDFTQTHNYINSANIENSLASISNDFITQYNKPILHGEFGINPSTSSLSVIDPNGIHIHNSIWATAFSGAMGAGMSWWWESYLDPRNLYTHYKPLSEFVSIIPLKKENFTRLIATTSGGGTGDLVLTPGVGFALAGASNFTIDLAGNVTPAASQLSSYLFGASWNTQLRNPPTFSVTFPTAGKFRVTTASSTGTQPTVVIYVDGKSSLSQNASINSTYSVDISAGAHTIKVDNLGTDWISISSYSFTGIGSLLNTYFLKNQDSTKVVGWIHNKKYNWVDAAPTASRPAAVTGATLSIPKVKNGNYSIRFIDCITGASTSNVTIASTNKLLVIPLPQISWDAAIECTFGDQTITSTEDVVAKNGIEIYPNPANCYHLTLEYDVIAPSLVNIELLDLTGKKMDTIISGLQPMGKQHIEWTALATISPGIYLVRSTIGSARFTNKVIIRCD
jgi:hypothetical protein